jgi:hypothetical protein
MPHPHNKCLTARPCFSYRIHSIYIYIQALFSLFSRILPGASNLAYSEFSSVFLLIEIQPFWLYILEPQRSLPRHLDTHLLSSPLAFCLALLLSVRKETVVFLPSPSY